MPGAGKSTLGRQLAESRKFKFVDLDEVIEQVAGLSIPEIFAQYGEDHFRELEKNALVQLLSKKEKMVLATGGGAPCYFNTMDQLLASGTVVFIDVDISTLVNRLKSKQSNRPKINQKESVESQIKNLYQKRKPIYERAHLSVSGEHISISDLQAVLA